MKKITNLHSAAFNSDSTALNRQAMDSVVCETIVKNSQNYNGVSYASIPLHLLSIPSYQRQKHSAVAKIAAEWNDKKCGAITVSYRDGKFWVVDGQNRVAAANIAGRPSIFSMILTGLTKEEEIEMFVDQNENCKIVSAYDKLRAQADGGMEPGTELLQLCRDANITLKNRGYAAPGVLACAAVLRRCYDRIGKDGIVWIFDVIKSLGWNAVQRGYSAVVLRTLTNMYIQASDKTEAKDRIVSLTNGMTPIETVRKASSIRPTYGEASALSLYWGA